MDYYFVCVCCGREWWLDEKDIELITPIDGTYNCTECGEGKSVYELREENREYYPY